MLVGIRHAAGGFGVVLYLTIRKQEKFEKERSAPFLPPGPRVRESALKQVPSSCSHPTQGYTHEHRKFNRSLPPLVAFIPI